MITTYPPPPGPRVELLRVRRVDASSSLTRSGPSLLRDQPPTPSLPQVDNLAVNEIALRRRADDLLESQVSGLPATNHQETQHGETP